jgi:hypothetical protein
MGILLVVLVLAALSTGFLMMALLPLVFLWLAFSIYKEPWREQAPAVLPERAPAVPVMQPSPDVEKPRVMVAGRRHPL